MFVAWVLGARHWLEPLTELGHFLEDFAASQLLNAGIMWLIYLALEPYVRRYSPEILMSWSRCSVAASAIRASAATSWSASPPGSLVGLARCALLLLPPLFGAAPPPLRGVSLDFLLSTRHALSALLRMPPTALFNGMLITLSFALARMLVKRTWPAALISGILLAFVLVTDAGTEQIGLNLLFAAVVSLVYVLVLVHYGMFAQMMAFLTNFILTQGGLTADFSKLYAPTSTWLLVLVVSLAAFGFLCLASRGAPLRKSVRCDVRNSGPGPLSLTGWSGRPVAHGQARKTPRDVTCRSITGESEEASRRLRRFENAGRDGGGFDRGQERDASRAASPLLNPFAPVHRRLDQHRSGIFALVRAGRKIDFGNRMRAVELDHEFVSGSLRPGAVQFASTVPSGIARSGTTAPEGIARTDLMGSAAPASELSERLLREQKQPFAWTGAGVGARQPDGRSLPSSRSHLPSCPSGRGQARTRPERAPRHHRDARAPA